MKKFISCMLVIVMMAAMAVAFTGCGEEKTGGKEGKLVVYGMAGGTDPAKQYVDAYYQEKWAANTDYEIEWIGGDFSMIMASGDYPDIVVGSFFQAADVAKYASQEVLIPMDEYISEENTPNIMRMFNEQPTTKATATSPDGHIYALPSYNGNMGAFIETCWWINMEWLEKLDLEVPTTLPELKEVLRAFKTGDPNGNGKADEIPMSFYNEGSYSYPETLLSCWGVATKFGMYDAYLNVQNGKVNFTPMMDEWKEMIKFYADLYKEGLLDIECFTYESNTWDSKLKADTPVIGVLFTNGTYFDENSQYKLIPPISADGQIEPVIHIHPGSIGTKNQVYVTSACKDPVAAMKWIDSFYSKEATITNWYGPTDDEVNDKVNATFHKDGDMYMWNDPAEQGYDSITKMYYGNSMGGPHIMGYINLEEDRGVLIEDSDVFKTFDAVWEMYQPYIDTETWPRPYYDLDDASRIGVLQADIFNFVERKKADWIMGRANVETDWDSYISQLKKLGADELLEINQRAYDVFSEAMSEVEK